MTEGQGELFDPKNFHKNGDREQNLRLTNLEKGQQEIGVKLDRLSDSIDALREEMHNAVNDIKEKSHNAANEQTETSHKIVDKIKDDKVKLEGRFTKLEERQAVLWRYMIAGGGGVLAVSHIISYLVQQGM